MSVSNGQSANATTFNGAFVSRTSDTSTVGVLTLNNTSNPNSGAQVTNAQRALNEIFDAVGMTGEADAGRNTYTSSFVVSNGDSRKVAIGKLDAEFNPATGHNHDGSNSAPISAASLTGINFYRADWQMVTVLGASGSAYVVTTEFSGKTPGGGTAVAGVATAAPENRCEIRNATTETYIEDGEGQRVYGRITESGGVWTLSFYTNEAGVETAHSLSSQDILVAFKEVFTLDTIPTFGADAGVLGSFDVTNDIVYATETIAGKILLADAAAESVGSTNAKGVSTAAAREDHVHRGLSAIEEFVEAVKFYGDVVLKAGTNVTITRTGGTFEIASTGGGGNAFEVEYRTLTGGEAAAKSLTLSQTPDDDTKVLVDVIGGTAQEFSVDFTCSGTTLSWTGLGLDSIPLVAGDKLRIVYTPA